MSWGRFPRVYLTSGQRVYEVLLPGVLAGPGHTLDVFQVLRQYQLLSKPCLRGCAHVCACARVCVHMCVQNREGQPPQVRFERAHSTEPHICVGKIWVWMRPASFLNARTEKPSSTRLAFEPVFTSGRFPRVAVNFPLWGH